MFPPPTTTATSTSRSLTRFTVRAIACRRFGSTPYSSPPSRASPDSFSSTRLKAGLPLCSAIARRIFVLVADLKPGEPADHHVLTGLGGQVCAQLLDRAALVAVGVHVLLVQEHDFLEPLLQPPLGDPLADLLGLV